MLRNEVCLNKTEGNWTLKNKYFQRNSLLPGKKGKYDFLFIFLLLGKTGPICYFY